MKSKITILIVLIVGGLLFYSCESCTTKNKIKFSGFVKSNSGNTVVGAKVEINDQKTETDEKGSFVLYLNPEQKDFLVKVRKFGFGYYSNRFTSAFTDKTITLTEGTIVPFDPSTGVTLTDSNSANNPFKPSLLSLDTAKLFAAIPKVYNSSGQLIDLGYPDGIKGVFDYLKIPVTGGPGISVTLPANSLVNSTGGTPSPGAKLQASLSTVDFFNPDGMPGDFTVRTKDGLGFMESFGAGTIEISDGEQLYQLKRDAKAKVIIPVYPIRLKLKESLPESIPFLRFNEQDGVWEEAGKGILNQSHTAYETEVDHFSVLNMDMIKTGPSKCFKIRQMLKRNATDNSSGYLGQYRAQIIVPATATSNFTERDYGVDETTGCVQVFSGINPTMLHPITRIRNEVPYLVLVFSKQGTADTLDIAIAQAAGTSIPAETAVASANDCSTNSCAATPCTSDPLDVAAALSNCNSTCWLPNCGFVPFSNLGDELRIVGVPMGGGKVKVKWVNLNSLVTTSIKVFAYTAGNCGGASTEIFTVCGGCVGPECKSGEVIFPGVAGGMVSFKISVYATIDCSGIPFSEICTAQNVTVI